MKIKKAGKVAGKTALQTGKAGFAAGKITFGTLATIFNTLHGNKGPSAAFFGKVSLMCAGTAGIGIGVAVAASGGVILILPAVLLPLAGLAAYGAKVTAKTPDEHMNPFRHFRQNHNR